ncbi:hypothetical protein [Nevskia ramosa]|nr:hypothetical protein [Nevskia ramosa]
MNLLTAATRMHENRQPLAANFPLDKVLLPETKATEWQIDSRSGGIEPS